MTKKEKVYSFVQVVIPLYLNLVLNIIAVQVGLVFSKRSLEQSKLRLISNYSYLVQNIIVLLAVDITDTYSTMVLNPQVNVTVTMV